MNAYVPQVGDKVRATLGKNVIVGEVEYCANGGVEIRVGRELFPVLVAGWQFEQIVSVPTKFGAIIRRADGVLFVLADPRGIDDVWFANDGNRWCFRENATEGGFSVLFDGVDE